MPRTTSLRIIRLLCVLCVEVFLSGCAHPTKFDPANLTFLIEANPVNLDPRFTTDGQSQRLDSVIFSSLPARDGEMNLRGDLAESSDINATRRGSLKRFLNLLGPDRALAQHLPGIAVQFHDC